MAADDNDDAPKPRSGGAKRAKPQTPVVKPLMIKTKTARSGAILKKKDLVDLVVEKSGVKKTDARSAVDATFDVLARALADGDEVVVPPLGKIRMMQTKDNGKARVMTLRVQSVGDTDTGNDPLADGQD